MSRFERRVMRQQWKEDNALRKRPIRWQRYIATLLNLPVRLFEFKNAEGKIIRTEQKWPTVRAPWRSRPLPNMTKQKESKDV